jgi:hypothetical protein
MKKSTERKPQTLLWSKGISLLEKRLTEPTLLEMSGNPGAFDRSMQHH